MYLLVYLEKDFKQFINNRTWENISLCFCGGTQKVEDCLLTMNLEVYRNRSRNERIHVELHVYKVIFNIFKKQLVVKCCVIEKEDSYWRCLPCLR